MGQIFQRLSLLAIAGKSEERFENTDQGNIGQGELGVGQVGLVLGGSFQKFQRVDSLGDLSLDFSEIDFCLGFVVNAVHDLIYFESVKIDQKVQKGVDLGFRQIV